MGLKRRLATLVLPALPDLFCFKRSGFCPCCRQEVDFLALDPWLRDSFQCTRCGSIPRNRALMLTLDRLFPSWRTLAIHESSPSGGGASARLQRECPGYVASQYRPGHARGDTVDGFRNEDLGAQTFADASFDVVVTQDVLEHVFDPPAVFREIARTLKPGGAHVCSVPLVNKHRPSEVWARLDASGSPAFLHEPEFHGNPVDPAGAPVAMHWGYDIVEHIERACGLETAIESIDDLHHGVRGEYIEILVTRKPGGTP